MFQLKVRSYGDKFISTTPKEWSIKEKIGNLDFIEIKNACSMKDREQKYWQQIFTKHITGKGLVSKIYKELF